ncbi:hypothetical protein DMUE_5462 [Dictyocoela muelleri]|nr:hypothetical protein DMUE_5462 [Dictyocoela muelleri]
MDKKINKFLQTFQTNLIQNIHKNPKIKNISTEYFALNKYKHILMPFRACDAVLKTIFDDSINSSLAKNSISMFLTPYKQYLDKLDQKMQNMNIPQYYGGLRITNDIGMKSNKLINEKNLKNLPEKYKGGLFMYLKFKYLQLKEKLSGNSIEDKFLNKITENIHLEDIFNDEALSQYKRKMNNSKILSIWNVDSYFEDFFVIEFEMRCSDGKNHLCIIKIDPTDMKIAYFDSK